MSVLEEVRQLKDQGMTDDQIVQMMRDKGVQYRDISEALAQTQIKAAVEQKDEPQVAYQAGQQVQDENMLQPSLLADAQAPQGTQAQYAQQEQQYQPQYYPGQDQQMPQAQNYQYQPQQQQEQQYAPTDAGQQDYNQYSYPQSTEMISEIAEQIVAEKMSDLRKNIEKVIDFRTSSESKIQFIDERLKRLEKVIDTLQSSVLRKVGDYVTNVEDIKREIVETQKTFSKLVPGRHHSQQTHQHPHNQHSQPKHHPHKK